MFAILLNDNVPVEHIQDNHDHEKVRKAMKDARKMKAKNNVDEVLKVNVTVYINTRVDLIPYYYET